MAVMGAVGSAALVVSGIACLFAVNALEGSVVVSLLLLVCGSATSASPSLRGRRVLA